MPIKLRDGPERPQSTHLLFILFTIAAEKDAEGPAPSLASTREENCFPRIPTRQPPRVVVNLTTQSLGPTWLTSVTETPRSRNSCLRTSRLGSCVGRLRFGNSPEQHMLLRRTTAKHMADRTSDTSMHPLQFKVCSWTTYDAMGPIALLALMAFEDHQTGISSAQNRWPLGLLEPIVQEQGAV